MEKKRSVRIIICCILFSILLCIYANADIVYLKNGRKIVGTIIKETDDAVIIDIGIGDVVHRKEEISSIEKGKGEIEQRPMGTAQKKTEVDLSKEILGTWKWEYLSATMTTTYSPNRRYMTKGKMPMDGRTHKWEDSGKYTINGNKITYSDVMRTERGKSRRVGIGIEEITEFSHNKFLAYQIKGGKRKSKAYRYRVK